MSRDYVMNRVIAHAIPAGIAKDVAERYALEHMDALLRVANGNLEKETVSNTAFFNALALSAEALRRLLSAYEAEHEYQMSICGRGLGHVDSESRAGALAAQAFRSKYGDIRS